jgi:hypothetical protein
MGGTSPSFMAMIARATCSVPGPGACWARASWRTFSQNSRALAVNGMNTGDRSSRRHSPVAGQVQPGRAGTSLDGPAGVREGIRFEGRFDPGAHGAQIDPDGRERVPVKTAEQAGPGPVTGKTGNLLLNALRCDAALAQEGSRSLAGRDQSEQEMLAADVTVPEPAGML